MQRPVEKRGPVEKWEPDIPILIAAKSEYAELQ